MKRIAIYGKGGIGKSKTASNISAALSLYGYKVMQIGCDPKADSTTNLIKKNNIKTILDLLRTNTSITLEDAILKGYNNILCAECGGPTPGVGCAGRGIITAFEFLDKHKTFERYNPDVVLYDVLGDVVCGGFAMPIRNGYAEDIYIVTSGEKMSVFAARNIAMAIDTFKERGYAKLKGIILNSRNIPNECDIVLALAKELNTEIVEVIPRDDIVQKCEEKKMTVIEGAPRSHMTQIYKNLAKKIIES